MQKTLIELFAGVGGFRCGLNNIKNIDDTNKSEKWHTVWFSQWEPGKKVQWAHDCYVNRFGTCLDTTGCDTTNIDISLVDKSNIPDANLLVGGFPCQNYSVASTLSSSKGIEGDKGVLWWDIRDTLETKNIPFVLLENVDRLLKSPAKQRGRDFGIILACFRDLGYNVEWRVINAAEYGLQQRRKRTYIFAYKNDTNYSHKVNDKIGYNPNSEIEQKRSNVVALIDELGFFAQSFPVQKFDEKLLKIDGIRMLPQNIGNISTDFEYNFENSGVLLDGVIYTVKTIPKCDSNAINIGEILETSNIAEKYFVPDNLLWYSSNHSQTHTDETNERMSAEQRHTWQYIKGAKRMWRRSSNGHEYVYSEGAIPMIDEWDKPARTMLTSEGSFNRSTHIVKDKETGRIRLLTPIETERIQGFPDDWTKECLTDNKIVEMPDNMRRFCMGNALVVDLISKMEIVLSDIFDKE